MLGMRTASALFASVILACSLTAHAQEQSVAGRVGRDSDACAPAEQANQQDAEPAGIGAGLVLDEHVLTDGSRDQDYNGGGEVTQSGRSPGFIGRGLDRALGFVDQGSCRLGRLTGLAGSSAHAFAAGILVFTPRNLAARNVVRGDRPYASLFFVSAGRRYASADSPVAYDTSLTVGVLGLAAADDVQRVLHDVTGSVRPRGWSHQISDGGEPTVRYRSPGRRYLPISAMAPGVETANGPVPSVSAP